MGNDSQPGKRQDRTHGVRGGTEPQLQPALWPTRSASHQDVQIPGSRTGGVRYEPQNAGTATQDSEECVRGPQRSGTTAGSSPRHAPGHHWLNLANVGPASAMLRCWRVGQRHEHRVTEKFTHMCGTMLLSAQHNTAAAIAQAEMGS